LTLLVSSAWRGSSIPPTWWCCACIWGLWRKSGCTQHRLSPCFQCLSATLRHHSLLPLTSSYIHFVRKSLHRVLNLHWSIEAKRCLPNFQSFSSGNHFRYINLAFAVNLYFELQLCCPSKLVRPVNRLSGTF
jgi:hypothetical protein